MPIVGRLKRPGDRDMAIAGVVDRLLVKPDAVLIVDYKTDRLVPRSLAEVPAYVGQLALYRAVLARICPGKAIRAALLFMDGPQIIEISGDAMATALAEIMGRVAPG